MGQYGSVDFESGIVWCWKVADGFKMESYGCRFGQGLLRFGFKVGAVGKDMFECLWEVLMLEWYK